VSIPNVAPELAASACIPLLPDAAPDSVMAIVDGKPVSRERFLREVLALAARLPEGQPLLNLCTSRYHFALGLLAAICRGNLSLLPNSLAEGNIAALREQHPDLLCLSDQPAMPFDLPGLRVEAQSGADTSCPAMPQIPVSQRVACVFTSGSTGKPQAHYKTFGKLVRNIQAQAQRNWAATSGPCAVLGTVPFQHMYGLESTVLLTLFGGGILSAPKPFFPADVADALAALPAPRFLVTTPYHLRKLLESGIPVPPLAGLLSATAPLSIELAREAEARFGAPLMEIYGSTETGQIATRLPTRDDVWQLHADIRLHQGSNDLSHVEGGHVEQPQVLGDIVEKLDEQHFRLVGRHADMINIAGKRSSLAFLNHTLQTLDGVVDGAFCLPHESDSARLAAFVVAPGLNAARITAALRPYLDPAFLPRPIIFLDQLPRNATGKLPAADLQALITRHIPDANA
jgi:acyl-coenzyme A synthetase/AMP-(fatty) acid ligase